MILITSHCHLLYILKFELTSFSLDAIARILHESCLSIVEVNRKINAGVSNFTSGRTEKISCRKYFKVIANNESTNSSSALPVVTSLVYKVDRFSPQRKAQYVLVRNTQVTEYVTTRSRMRHHSFPKCIRELRRERMQYSLSNIKVRRRGEVGSLKRSAFPLATFTEGETRGDGKWK